MLIWSWQGLVINSEFSDSRDPYIFAVDDDEPWNACSPETIQIVQTNWSNSKNWAFIRVCAWYDGEIRIYEFMFEYGVPGSSCGPRECQMS